MYMKKLSGKSARERRFTEMRTYNENFYKSNVFYAKRSADEIMPFLIEKLSPKSIIDFG